MALIEHATGFRNAQRFLRNDFDQFDAEFDACIELIRHPKGNTPQQRAVCKRAAEVRASICNDQMRILKRLLEG